MASCPGSRRTPGGGSPSRQTRRVGRTVRGQTRRIGHCVRGRGRARRVGRGHSRRPRRIHVGKARRVGRMNGRLTNRIGMRGRRQAGRSRCRRGTMDLGEASEIESKDRERKYHAKGHHSPRASHAASDARRPCHFRDFHPLISACFVLHANGPADAYLCAGSTKSALFNFPGEVEAWTSSFMFAVYC